MTVKLLCLHNGEMMLAGKSKCVRDAWIWWYFDSSYQAIKITEVFWIHSSHHLQKTFDFSHRDAIPFPWGWKRRHSAVPICSVVLNCNKLDSFTHFPAPDKHPAWNFGAIEHSSYIRHRLTVLMHILLLQKTTFGNNYHVCEEENKIK